jgi:hypothetical protein
MAKELPHESAFTRLAPSDIAGVGVFALRDISEETDIFPNDRLGIRWIDRSIVDGIEDRTARELYAEFAIRQGEQYGCPENFNSMTVGWYLNEPKPGDDPNVVVDANYAFFAAREIRAGEELTVRYENFSEG